MGVGKVEGNVRKAPGPVARLVTEKGRSTKENGIMQMGVKAGLLYGIVRTDDALLFGNPIPPTILNSIAFARMPEGSAIAESRLVQREAAIRQLKAAETYFRAFKDGVGMAWQHIVTPGFDLEVLCHTMCVNLVEAVLTDLEISGIELYNPKVRGATGLSPNHIDWVISWLNGLGFPVRLPTNEEYQILLTGVDSESAFSLGLEYKGRELTGSINGENRLVRNLTIPYASFPPASNVSEVSADAVLTDVTFRLVRPFKQD